MEAGQSITSEAPSPSCFHSLCNRVIGLSCVSRWVFDVLVRWQWAEEEEEEEEEEDSYATRVITSYLIGVTITRTKADTRGMGRNNCQPDSSPGSRVPFIGKLRAARLIRTPQVFS